MIRPLLLAACLGSAALFGTSGFSHGSNTPKDFEYYLQNRNTHHKSSGVNGPKYNRIVKGMKNLQKRFPKLVEVHNFGRSVNRQELMIYKIYDKEVKKTGKRPAIFISGTTHGDEYLNVADQLPKLFLEKRGPNGFRNFLAAGGHLYVLPILNPDGYDRNKRRNSNRADLNRDFPLEIKRHPGFKEVETRHLNKYLSKEIDGNNLKLEVSNDYHCCIGAILYPWSYTKKPLPKEDLERHLVIARRMKEIFGYEYGTTGDILGYRPLGTSKDFYYERYGAVTYTFEGKDEQAERRRIKDHVLWWNWIFNHVIKPYPLAG